MLLQVCSTLWDLNLLSPQQQFQQRPPPQRPPPPPRRPIRPAQPNRRKDSGGSFFDFLIPSFVRGTNKKADKPPPPPPRPRFRPSSTVQQQQPLSHQRPLPPPQRPPSSQPNFPPPHQLGGALNPIILRIPDTGVPNFPPPPPQAFHQRPKQPRIDARLGTGVVADDYPEDQLAMETEEVTVRSGSTAADRTSVPGTLQTRPTGPQRASTVPLGVTTSGQPLLSLPRAPPVRQQKPFIPRNPPVQPPSPANLDFRLAVRPDHRRPQGPERPPVLSVPQQPISLPKRLYEYRNRLKDPEFHQNVTKALVYHSTDAAKEKEDPVPTRQVYFEAEQQQVEQEIPSQLQDSNPFYLKPKSQVPSLGYSLSLLKEKEDSE